MSNTVDEDGYDDSNRAFLQAFMARASMTFEEVKPVLASILSVHGWYPLFVLLMIYWLLTNYNAQV